MFTLIEPTLYYYLDDKQPDIKQIVVPGIFESKYCKIVTLVVWQVTFLEYGYTRHCQDDGGGMECTKML